MINWLFRRCCVMLLVFTAGVSLSAQSRDRIRVFVPTPSGGTAEQRSYFAEQFRVEIGGAGYQVADTRPDSDITFQVNIENNPDYGYYRDEERYLMLIRILRGNADDEVVRFSFAFSSLENMNDWNLFLVYKAMANVALESGGDLPPDNDASEAALARTSVPGGFWRDKWLYLNAAIGGDMAYFLRPGTMLTEQGMVMPAGLLGAELHFLDFLSVELDPVKIRFLNNGDKYLFTPGMAALLKGVFKISDFLMLEPYSGAEYTPNLSGAATPWLSFLGGIQFGFRGGQREAICIDINVTYSLLGELQLANETSKGTLTFSLLAGCKVGFFDRPRKSAL